MAQMACWTPRGDERLSASGRFQNLSGGREYLGATLHLTGHCDKGLQLISFSEPGGKRVYITRMQRCHQSTPVGYAQLTVFVLIFACLLFVLFGCYKAEAATEVRKHRDINQPWGKFDLLCFSLHWEKTAMILF